MVADPEPAQFTPARPLGHRLRRPGLLEGAPGLHQEQPAGVAESRTAAFADEQVDAQRRLEAQDLLGEGGLCDVQAGRGAGEVELLGDGDEGLQVPQVELHARTLSSHLFSVFDLMNGDS